MINEEYDTLYDDLEFLLNIYDKTMGGNDFMEVAKRIVRYLSEKELWIIWLSFKAFDNK